jgi:hypothetical protein
VRLIILVLGLVITGLACNRKPEVKGPARHYELRGRVVSLNNKSQTASIDTQAIPNYMEAMSMDYPVPSRQEFSRLHVGDQIKGTLNVYESGDYDLSSIQDEKGR